MWESFNNRLDKWAWERPDHAAVIQAARRISYCKLREHSVALAHAWRENKVEPGDRVVSYCGNTLEAVVTMAACQRCGAVFVPLHPSTKPSKLARLLQELEPVVLVASHGKKADLRRVALEVGKMPTVFYTDVESAEDLPPSFSDGQPESEFDVQFFWQCCSNIPTEEKVLVEWNADAPAAILYTAVAEGGPRGVVLSNENLTFAADAVNRYVGNTHDDVILDALPMSLGTGFQQVLAILRAGGTLVLEPSFAYPAAVLQRIEETHATGFPLVPSMAGILMHVDVERFNLSSLRYVVSLCGPMAREHAVRLNEAFPTARLLSVYGRTECLHTTCLETCEAELAVTRVGKTHPEVEARVVDAHGGEVPPEIDGELHVRGPNVMLGYWRRPDATDQVLRVDSESGRREFRCHDLLYADLDGNLHFVGRTDGLLDIGGEEVSPREVETTLCSHPAVIDAVVYGDEDELYLDRRVCALVRLQRNEQISERELQRFCAEHLEDFMVPAVIRIRHQALPKAKVRQMFGSTLAPSER